ncbi:MAG: aldo/keto reductase [Planctomycetota bacterium]|nr:aldo/keto reductase [Planctomycetota bacterium]
MELRMLGRAGVKVAPLCLGNMNFGSEKCDEALSRRIMERAVEAGLNFFDTANVYQKQKSEEILGRWLKEGGARRRDGLVLATKVYGKVGETDNDRGLSRRHILRAVEDSLRRLQTDRIDLYQCHHWDTVRIEETVRALDDLIRAGKAVYWGTSNFKAWHLTEATLVADRLHASVPVSEQCPYSITNRHVETELAPFCMKYNVRMLPWSPLNAGRLSGIYRKGKPIPDTPRNKSEVFRKRLESQMDLLESLGRLADELGRPLSQLAYAWLVRQPHVASVIVGPRTVEMLDDALASLDLKLSEDVLKKIDELVPPGSAPDFVGW